MAIINELPPDGTDPGDVGNDRQIQPMEHEVQNGEDGELDVGDRMFRAQVAEEREQYQPTPLEKVMAMMKSLFLRGMVIYFVVSVFRRPTTPAPAASEGGVSVPSLPKGAAVNLFTNGILFDLHVFLSEDPEFVDFNDSGALIWTKKDLVYGDWESGPDGDGTYTFSTEIEATEALQNNGSIYLHSFVVKAGKSPDPAAGKGKFSKKWTMYKSRMMNKFKKKYYAKTANLLTGETTATIEEQAKAAEGIKHEIFSHWHPNVTINLVNDNTPWVPGQVPPPLDEFVEFTPSFVNYKPILYMNDYWNLNKDYTPINDTVKTLNLTIIYQPLTMFKWQMYSAQAMRNRFNVMGSLMGDDDEDQDQDSIKEAFLETNFYLLVMTFVVSILHTIFEFLAFKNDIQFWKNQKSLHGLSVRSVFFNVFQSGVVLLYVLDSETNAMIKVSCFVGLGIEIWKINKVIDFSIDRENPILGVIPRLTFKDKSDYEDSGTKAFDRMAFRYLGMAFFPLAICYCIYSAIYNEHKGWYSFVLSSTYGFLLTFGFIMMTPQLFINYKLKSVAHLPWRMMTYKALNTFIDDIFAFVIKMPTMYRLGCFRDDIVFFIFLYQKYVYRVDLSRVNEFGYSGEMLDEVAQKKIEESAKSDENQPQKQIEDKKKD